MCLVPFVANNSLTWQRVTPRAKQMNICTGAMSAMWISQSSKAKRANDALFARAQNIFEKGVDKSIFI
jgi:hypothetical protein